jgi:hypothetical protein
MPEPEWPKPPIRFEDLPDVLELLGPDSNNVLRGWVLVPLYCFAQPTSLPHPLTRAVRRFAARVRRTQYSGDRTQTFSLTLRAPSQIEAGTTRNRAVVLVTCTEFSFLPSVWPSRSTSPIRGDCTFAGSHLL